MKKKKVIKISMSFFAIIAILCVALMLKCNQIKEDNPQTTIYSFFGKPIVINDLIDEQISAIADQDKMLSYNDSIIQIGDVRWGVNLMLDCIVSKDW